MHRVFFKTHIYQALYDSMATLEDSSWDVPVLRAYSTRVGLDWTLAKSLKLSSNSLQTLLETLFETFFKPSLNLLKTFFDLSEGMLC